jgi:hypothetical protein
MEGRREDTREAVWGGVDKEKERTAEQKKKDYGSMRKGITARKEKPRTEGTKR